MTTTQMTNFESMISDRALGIDVSGIRRVFELGAKLANPINLSIGQPDFPVPDAIKNATIKAIQTNHNGYTLTQGAPQLLRSVQNRMTSDVGWDFESDDLSVMITAGTSGALLLAFLALLNPGDEAIIGDPYFVIYPAHAQIAGGTAVYCDTYPDFRMTAERIEPLITERTKLVLINSPGNPSGVVLSEQEVRDIAALCERRGVLLISDEIYDEFTYVDARENGTCPSPARFTERCLLVRGFGKTYGCTGWRLGYVAGPTPVIQQMMKLQQYSFVCAPSMAQVGLAGAFDVDMGDLVERYRRRRDSVLEAFDGVADLVKPGGAFYGFVKVPAHLGLTATQFAERAIEHSVLTIPGAVFSQSDTHVRLSYAVAEDKLVQGLTILRQLMTA